MDEKNLRLNEIIRRIAEDDKQAQVDLLHAYGRLIKSAAMSVSRKVSPDDVVISVFTKIVINAGKIADKGITLQWLYKISVNEAINMAKKERNFYKIHQPLSDEAATDFYFLEEDKSISELDFERIINILNDDEKKIVTLKCVYELTFAQIADILKKPLPTIASKYRKALEKIEKYF